MNYQQYTALLKSLINTQPYNHQLVFAVMICKKLFFEYQNLVEVYKWGDADLLMEAIDICEQSIVHPSDITHLKELLAKIDLIIPDTEDFGDNIGSYALNASCAVYETLEFIIDHNQNHIYTIATYYTDTIDFKIQEEKDLNEWKIDNHPLMIETRNFILEQIKAPNK